MFLHDFSHACFGAIEHHTPMLQGFCHLHTVLQDLTIDHIHAGKIQCEALGWNYPFSALVLALHFQIIHVSKLRLTYDFVASLAQAAAPGVHSSETQRIPSHPASLSTNGKLARNMEGFRAICRPFCEIGLFSA